MQSGRVSLFKALHPTHTSALISQAVRRVPSVRTFWALSSSLVEAIVAVSLPQKAPLHRSGSLPAGIPFPDLSWQVPRLEAQLLHSYDHGETSKQPHAKLAKLE